MRLECKIIKHTRRTSTIYKRSHNHTTYTPSVKDQMYSCSSLWTWGSSVESSHKYLLLTLLLIDSLWKCLIQIILKLSSTVSRSSVSVYQVSLWPVTPKFFKAKLGSVRIFLSRESCICKLIYFVTLPAIDVFILTCVSIRASDCMCVLDCCVP